MRQSLQLVSRTGHPDFLDLPWELPLEEWKSIRLVDVMRGISRHIVRFVEYEGTLYALKETPPRIARREYGLLRALAGKELPVVEAVGVAERGDDLEAVLITRHLDFSLPLRALVERGGFGGLRDRLLDAGAELLARLHIAGFFWGDFSLSNTLFRRDAGALSAYVVDVETGELHPELSNGQRRHDLEIARENLIGELLDVEEEMGVAFAAEPEQVADELTRRYESLWDELTREETFGPDERYRIDERLRRLNELGFDVDELEILTGPDGFRLRVGTRVVEPGHHRRRLLMLTGLRAQENQARRLLNDLARYRASLEREARRPLPEGVVAYRWLAEVFEPAIAAVPSDLWGKREAAEIFHELLDHRWYLSQAAGRDVGLLPAMESYVETVLRRAPEERAVLGPTE